MKLTNPTDDELNAAFADIVYGRRCEKCGKFHDKYNEGVNEDSLKFTDSADAVLPWLEKRELQWSAGHRMYAKDFFCSIQTKITQDGWDEERASATDSSFPRACVIALLRAHGVEVEFTP